MEDRRKEFDEAWRAKFEELKLEVEKFDRYIAGDPHPVVVFQRLSTIENILEYIRVMQFKLVPKTCMNVPLYFPGD